MGLTICWLKIKQLLRIRRHSTHCCHRAPEYIWSKPSKFGFTEVFLLQNICVVFKNKFRRLPLSYSNDFSVVRSVSTFTFSSVSTNISGKESISLIRVKYSWRQKSATIWVFCHYLETWRISHRRYRFEYKDSIVF